MDKKTAIIAIIMLTIVFAIIVAAYLYVKLNS